MRYYKIVSLSTVTFALGLMVGEIHHAETPVLPVTVKKKLPGYMNMYDPVIVALQNANKRISELSREYEDLYISYDKLLGDYDNLIKTPVFDSNNVLLSSNANIYHIRRALEGTELLPLASTFYEAEQTYGINAFFLMGIVALESGWGLSERALNDNNLTGYAVYSDESVGRVFDSKEDCILETSRLLKEDYLTEGGKYYTEPSIQSINTKYSSSDLWNVKVTRIANELLANAKLWGVE